MKISILTLGCRTNQAESFSLERAIHESGHQIVDMSEIPDICIINTCTVTEKADHQSNHLINTVSKKVARVIVTGCYAESHNEMITNTKGGLELVKNADKHNIINLIPKSTSSITSSYYNHSRHRPNVKVQDGCDFSCTYCSIPLARGKSRSIAIKDVLNEINTYESIGYNEVVLTGIHLGTYGFDFEPKQTLSVLIEHILKETRIKRIRLSSLELNEIDDKLLELMSDVRLCSHLHIPLQSGDDSILKLMQRNYTTKDFIRRVNKIQECLPMTALGTDIIVGFPGEGDLEFQNTMYLIESLPFSYLHIFPYSSRPGTKAAGFPNKISESQKKMRVDLLRSLGSKKKQSYVKDNIGKDLEIIVESVAEKFLTGTSSNYIKVNLPNSGGIKAGMIVNARISGYENGITSGVLTCKPHVFSN